MGKEKTTADSGRAGNTESMDMNNMSASVILTKGNEKER